MAGWLADPQVGWLCLKVLHAAVEIVKVNAMSKRLRIDVDIDPSLPTFVVGDQQRLRQVLLNLLFNAVKFTPQGRIAVTAALQQDFANHMRLMFAVEAPSPRSKRRARAAM